MGKKHPDELVSALSKLLKNPKTPTIRLTFKRGGLWQPHFAKAHSRKAKIALKSQLKAQAATPKSQEQPWPLLARLKTNEKEDALKLGTDVKPGRGSSVIQSLLGVFRVNFFKKKGEDEKKGEKKQATKADPNSKSTMRHKLKTERNRERRKKRLQIRREASRKQKTGK